MLAWRAGTNLVLVQKLHGLLKLTFSLVNASQQTDLITKLLKSLVINETLDPKGNYYLNTNGSHSSKIPVYVRIIIRQMFRSKTEDWHWQTLPPFPTMNTSNTHYLTD